MVDLVVQLAARVSELEAQLGQPPKTSGTSSVRPSSEAIGACVGAGPVIGSDKTGARVGTTAWQNARRLQTRYQEHRAGLFGFLDRPDVPPTNSPFEQDLRPSVIHHKVTGGVRSQLGADVSAGVTSLLSTARKQGDNFFQARRSIAGPSPLRAAGMPA